jgi:hypothetical protein
MKRARLGVVVTAFYSLILCGCGGAKIPNAVSDREYEVYSAWISHHFEKGAPKTLYLYSRTAVFAPSARYGCGEMLNRQDGISKNMIGQFDALGTAQYPLSFSNDQQKIAWSFKEIESPPAGPDSGYHALTFSRIAFSRAGDEALFTASDMCAVQCGGGSAFFAHKAEGIWRFRATHCAWVY